MQHVNYESVEKEVWAQMWLLTQIRLRTNVIYPLVRNRLLYTFIYYADPIFFLSFNHYIENSWTSSLLYFLTSFLFTTNSKPIAVNSWQMTIDLQQPTISRDQQNDWRGTTRSLPGLLTDDDAHLSNATNEMNIDEDDFYGGAIFGESTNHRCLPLRLQSPSTTASNF